MMEFLTSPVKESDVRSLKVGDIVYITGKIVTGRDEMHLRVIEYLNEGKEIPENLRGCTLYHCGPILAKTENGYEPVAAGPTTSARMNSIESRVIRELGIHAVIGKGGMSDEVVETMKECGCVYLAATGGAGVTLAEGLARVSGVEWEDLGMAEAAWIFDAVRFGPLIVAVDCNGNNLYKDVRDSLKR